MLEGQAIGDRYKLRQALRFRARSWSFVADNLQSRGKRFLRIIVPNESVDALSLHRTDLLMLRNKNLLSYETLAPTGIKHRDGSLWFVVRRFGRATLSQLLASNLSIDTSEAVALSVAGALTYLHSQGRIHGDVRPANVVLHRSQFWLTDYSVGKPDISLPDSLSDAAKEYPYLPPEVWTGEDFSAAADAYSYGALLFRLVTGRPISVTTGHSELRRLLRPDIHGRRRGIYEEIISACLSPAPLDRPPMYVIEDILFQGGRSSANQAIELLLSAETRDIAYKTLLTHGGTKLVTSNYDELVAQATEELVRDFRSQPYLAAKCFSSHQVAARLARAVLLAPDSGESHGNERRRKAAGTSDRRIHFEKARDLRYAPPPEIDGEWAAQIREHYRTFVERELMDPAVHGLPASDRALLQPSAADVLDWIAKEISSANELRSSILSEDFILTADVLALLRQHKIDISIDDIDELRHVGKLLGLPDHGRILYPVFQFDAYQSKPHAVIVDVNRLLDSASSPWAVASWWHRPHPYIDWQAPIDLLGTQEERLLVEAALSSRGVEVPSETQAGPVTR
jgi:hypothetical protein